MEDSAVGRLLTVFTSPEKTFRSIAARPTWVWPLVASTVVGLGLMLVMNSRIDWEAVAREQLASVADRLSPEQLEAQVEMAAKLGPVFPLLAVGLGPWIFTPLLALVFWGLLRALGSRFDYRTSLAVLAHGFMPWVLAALLSLPIAFGQAEISAEQLEQGGVLLSNLAFLAPDDAGKPLKTLLASLDLFSLWTLVLLAIGYRVAASVSRTTAAVTVVSLWLVWVLGKVGLVAMSQSLGS